MVMARGPAMTRRVEARKRCHRASCPKSPAPKAARCDPRPSSCAPQGSSRLRVADQFRSTELQALRSTNCETREAKCLHRAAIGSRQLWRELRCFGVGQGGVVTRLTLRPLRKFFPKLLGQFGRIAKFMIVDVDASATLDRPYYDRVTPLITQQLGFAGLRLARYLNDVFSSSQCP